jgi:3-oxoacyl-[acyl-carrier protein] reductase/2-deoxy-D-gluconate 3-dehydrogenase
MEVPGLKGRVAVITAAGQNIGKAVALAFARAGAHIVITGGSDAAKIEAVADEARSLGVEAIASVCDGTDEAAMNALIGRAVAELGRVDIAVSCVGIRPHQPIDEITLQDWQKVIDTNLGSAFILTQAVLPHMRRRKFGRLLYMAGTDALFPLANRAHVVAAKHGMHGLAKAVALECGPDGVTANSIAPGWLDTDRNAAWYPDLAETYEHVKATVPLRTLGTAEDVANACLYLASDMGKFVTGHLLHVNGGEFMV